MIRVKIKENSFIASLAARKLKSDKVAMVVGRTIHLHKTSREEFLRNPRWVRHEIAHVLQYQQLGLIRFLGMYLLEWFNKGYENISFEVEARHKEKDSSILNEIQFC